MSEEEQSMNEALSEAFEESEGETVEAVTEPVAVETTIEGGDVATEEVEKVEALKAPQSWGVVEREAWANIPPEVQAQIDKREREIGVSLSSTGDARKFQSEFQQAVQPFEGFIRAEGATPMQAVSQLLQTGATLQAGTPNQKAARIAELINHYGVDINALDTILVGEQPNPEQQQMGEFGQMLNKAMGPVNQFMAQQQQQQAQQVQQSQDSTNNEIGQFMNQNEFASDLRMEMADMMEFASRRNETMTLPQAYEKAIMMRPDIQKVIQQRKDAGAAQQNNRTVQQKRAASASVPGGQQMQGGAAQPSTMREAIEAAMNQN